MKELLSRPATKRVLFATVAVLVFAGVVAVATHSQAGIGDARLRTKGHATITTAGGQRRTVTGTVALRNGDTVEIVDGEMTIDLPSGATVEGRTGYKDNDATKVKIARPVELLAGEMLVVARDGVDVDSGGNRVHLERGVDGDAAARVSRALAVAAGVYRGNATLDSAGQTRPLPALRSIEVSSLGRPSSLTPLSVNDDDGWDRRFLGEAMDLGHVLDNYSASYTSTLGPDTRTPRNYRDILPSLQNEDGLTTELLASRPHTTGETVIAAAIAGLSRRGAFADRFRAIFDFRDAGARWGLVALDQGVGRDALLAEVQHALNNEQFQFTEAARTTPTAGGKPSTTTTTPSGPGGTTTTTTSPTEPQPPPTTTTIVPPSGQPLVDGLVGTVNQLLGGAPSGTGGGP